MITCPRCGYQAPDGTPYCPRCGYGRQPVSPAPAGSAPVEAAPIEAAPKQKKINIFSWIPWILLLIAVLGLIGALQDPHLATESQVKAAEKTIAALNSDLAAMEATVSAQEAEITELREAAAAPAAMPTDISSAAAPAEVPANVPDLCKDPQLRLIQLAEVLDADGHPYPDEYNEMNESCRYRVMDTTSWMNTDSFGELYLFFEDGRPYMANLAISYKDSDQIREVIRDWGAVAISYIDPATNVLAAQSIILSAASSGTAETDNVEATAQLHTDTMIYRIVVRDKSILE